jgi:hypothetical protein
MVFITHPTWEKWWRDLHQVGDGFDESLCAMQALFILVGALKRPAMC